MIRKIIERMAGIKNRSCEREMEALQAETRLLFLARDVCTDASKIEARVKSTARRVNGARFLKRKDGTDGRA